MTFSVNLEATEEFRQHVKQMITGQVRSILRAELEGIVHGELAKLRLMRPDSTAMSELISKEVNHQIKEEVSRAVREIRKEMADEVARHARDVVAPLLAQIRSDIKSHLIQAIRNIQ